MKAAEENQLVSVWLMGESTHKIGCELDVLCFSQSRGGGISRSRCGFGIRSILNQLLRRASSTASTGSGTPAGPEFAVTMISFHLPWE